MITEDYCSFEVARLLKAKGFDEPCQFLYFSKYKQEGDFVGNFNARKNSEINEESYSAPTHQMAMKWLREVHKLFIMILLLEKEEGNYGYTVEKIESREFISTSGNISYDTTEDAAEAALKYTLENLI